MLEPSSSEESDVDADEPTGFAAADAPRPGGRQLPVLGGRVAGFAAVGAFGFGQTGLAGALNSAAASVSVSSSASLTAASCTSSIAPPNIDLLQQRSHSLSTGIVYLRQATHAPASDSVFFRRGETTHLNFIIGLFDYRIRIRIRNES